MRGYLFSAFLFGVACGVVIFASVVVCDILDRCIERVRARFCEDCGGTGMVPAGGGERDVVDGYVRCGSCRT